VRSDDDRQAHVDRAGRLGQRFALRADDRGAGHDAALAAIQSPVDGQLYYNTQNTIPVEYTTSDVCSTPSVAMALDGEAFSGTEIVINEMVYGEHVFCVTSTDACGNPTTVCVTFDVQPLPAACFEVRDLDMQFKAKGDDDDDDDGVDPSGKGIACG